MSPSYKCSENIEIMEIDQEWIVMETERFTITKINELGAYILNAIKDQKNLDEVVEMIHLNYDIGLKTAKEDTSSFIEELIRAGLIIHER